MIFLADSTECCGCGACAAACHNGSINIVVNEEGFNYPVIDTVSCVECNNCRKVCPVLKEKTSLTTPKTVYACSNKNQAIKDKSSSGGAFSSLAEYVILQGGVVYGFAFDDEFLVKCICVENILDLPKLYGSKYVEGTIDKAVFLDIKKQIASGRKVLFSGTPCQVAAVKSFVGINAENLITVEVICHGVPSQKVYESYLNYLKNKYKSDIKSITFRSKKYNWENYATSIEFSNRKKYQKINSVESKYMRGFLLNIYLRKSCGNCKFKIDNTSADITLGDFWRIDRWHKDMYKKDGVSLVVVNSQNGKELFDKIKETIEFSEVNYETAIKCNRVLNNSNPTNPTREAFFRDFIAGDLNYEQLMKKYCHIKIHDRLLTNLGLKPLLKKLLKR